jgi:hypothetical protein
MGDDLRARVDALDWYHTFELPGGIVTPGLFDHRKVVGKLPIPASLAGKRCLDAASSDGFFAFEMARRGAAEVVSVDLADASAQDWQRLPRDPAAAQRGTGREPDGTLLSYEAVSLPQTLLRPRTPTAQLWHEDHAQWWTPNLAGHRRLLHAGGWEVTSSGGPLFQPFGARMPRWPDKLPRRPREWVFWTCTRRVGGATAWALARPRAD